MSKRTRYVYPNDMVAHIWANQSQESARSPNYNMYFEGDTIYSYGSHFPIARIIPRGGKRDPVVLMTSRKYSVTTSQHCGIVWSACKHLEQISCENPRAQSAEGHARNVEAMLSNAAQCLKGARRARANGNYFLATHDELITNARAYSRLFKLKFRYRPPRDLEQVREIAEQRRVKHEKAQAVKWERQRAEREERARLRAIAERADQIATARALRTSIPLWRSGKCGRYDAGLHLIRPTLIRAHNGNLETSKGADVPLEHARKAFVRVFACRKYRTHWRSNGESIRVGHFQIRQIDARGNVTAGCHFIRWNEIERLARREGWIGKVLI